MSTAAASAHTSPFAHLLRRSRFASFDPTIKQVYGTPPAHSHRGDYGIKRPLPMLRRKNAFFTLNAVMDAREQYTEWVKGESQVRFIRRFEELDVNPTVPLNSEWAQMQSSKSVTGWLTDSEFSTADETSEVEEVLSPMDRARQRAEAAPSRVRPAGGRTPSLGSSSLSPNVRAMSDTEFTRFAERLRKLRPAFREFIDHYYPEFKGKSLFELSQKRVAGLHRRFLEHITFLDFGTLESRKIEPQPHRNGGLVYHHPTNLHTQLFSPMERGIYLQSDNSQNHRTAISGGVSYGSGNMVSFAGLRATIPVIPPKKTMMYNFRRKGVVLDYANRMRAVDKMRIVPGSVRLDAIPRTVGKQAMGVKGVKLRTVVTPSHFLANATIPHFPGTYHYATHELEQDVFELSSVEEDGAAKSAEEQDEDRWRYYNMPMPLADYPERNPEPEKTASRNTAVMDLLTRLTKR
ncbi:hypothetical protein CYLTODRAFT_419765 [Cylindrobasidium torrendii FP15055 ss-10]|uniref:Uncharacterized protein n=1 Tax=Cylindrobasidium torrendii FP15055 ss-10 TaxID=1314674 RepID=A0A0D7BIM3_9AGAR|nr:hypothetical protein CYLTODRAFT_419765 [Cylindrobasidium torrendii FP15055 ss-10]